MTSSPLIEVENIYRNFGPVEAVRGLSFSLHSGEVLGFLGPNGAGKSTTMRLITGNLAASAGRITLGGYDLQQDPIAARRLLGYLPDVPPLYRDSRVNEFLKFCGRLHGLSSDPLTVAVTRAIERCGLGNVRNELIGHLSKGYQQRVGIAQAIVHDPELVVLDEPTVGLDPRQIEEIRQLIRELGQTQSVILSTHILSEVQAVCSHVQIINNGELVLHSTLAELDLAIGTRRYTVSFQTPPAAEQLSPLPGIGEIIQQAQSQPGDKPGDQYQISFSDETVGIGALLRASLDQGWGLNQLTATSASLEQLFLQLTDSGLADSEQMDGATPAQPSTEGLQ